MINNNTQPQPPRDAKNTIILTSVFGFVFCCGAMYSVSFLLAKIDVYKDINWTANLLMLSGLGWAKFPFFGADYYYHLMSKATHVQYYAVPYFIDFFAGAGGLLGALLGWEITTPQRGRLHIAGRQLQMGSRAIKTLKKQMIVEQKISGEGIKIHPEITISRDRETRHIIAVGSTGGGKTTIILPIIEQIIDRSDKILIYDNKGEMTQKCTSKNPIILAPWDERCLAWDISADIENDADARNFAASIIKDSSDPMWSEASRAILVAIIISLIKTKEIWSLTDIFNEISKGYLHLRDLVMRFTPTNIYAVEEAQKSKTTQSFLIILSSYLSTIKELETGWKGKKAISFRRWISSEGPERNYSTLILQGNKRYKKLEQAYVQSIMQTIGGFVSSPELEESTDRRVWIAFDEVAQAGEVAEITNLMEIGRSKGICVILGMQDIAQIKELYSPNIAEIWASLVGTYFVCRTQGVETTEFLSKLIGKEKVRKYVPAYSGGIDGSIAEQRQDSWIDEDEFLLRPDEISSKLGANRDGITAICVTGGDDVFLLNWPFARFEARRPALIKADWTKRQPVSFMPPQLQQRGAKDEKDSNGKGMAGAEGSGEVEQHTQQPDPEPKQVQDKDNTKTRGIPLTLNKAHASVRAEKEVEEPEADAEETAVSELTNEALTGMEEATQIGEALEMASTLIGKKDKKSSTPATNFFDIDEEEEPEC